MPILQILVKVIDSILTERQRESAESTMRTRMIVCYFLFQSSFNIIGLVSLIKFLRFKEFFASGTFLGAALFCLFLIRKDFSPEKVAASYLTTALAFVCLAIVGTPASTPVDIYLTNGFVINLTIALLILPSLSIRRRVFFLFLLGTGVTYWSFFKSFDGGLISFRTRLATPTILLYPGYILILVAMNLKIRELAQNDIDRENEWQQRNLKLDELSTLTRTLRHLFDSPIRAFQEDLESLERNHDKTTMNRMQRNLDELVLISQGFNWIYRAYRKEGFSSISSTKLLDQLRVLLSSKLKEEGWTLGISHDGQPVEVHGPIPSLVLFLFTVVIQIVETSQPEGKRQLSLEMGQEGRSLFWKVHWPCPGVTNLGNSKTRAEEPNSKTNVRQDLIRELLSVCDADMQEFREQSICHILIRVPQKQLKAFRSPAFV